MLSTILLTILLLISALGAAASVGCLIHLVGTGARPVTPPVQTQQEEEPGGGSASRLPLSDAKMQEGIANLLSYDIGGRGEQIQ